MNLGSFWNLPPAVRKTLEILTGKQTWTLDCYRLENGLWAFDLPLLLTWQELFVGGTELNFDHWYAKLTDKIPTKGSKMKVTVSSSVLEDQTTECRFLFNDDEFHTMSRTNKESASYYRDLESGLHIWLCPYVQFLFGVKPETLYVKMEPQ